MPVKNHMAHVIRSMPMLYDKEHGKEIGLDKDENLNIFVLP